MWFRRRRSPGVAISLVCGCALVSLYLFQRDVWRDCATHDRYSPERFVARYEALRPLLPREEVAGFVLDEGHLETKRLHPGARLFLAQYAVSPRRLTRDAGLRWVVVDSDSPEVAPDMATKAHWTLQADLHNGVRLYRTDVKK
jgi:hypothetical protein